MKKYLFIVLIISFTNLSFTEENCLADFDLHGPVSSCTETVYRFTSSQEGKESRWSTRSFNKDEYLLNETIGRRNARRREYSYDKENRIISKIVSTSTNRYDKTYYEYYSDGSVKITRYYNSSLSSISVKDSEGYLLSEEKYGSYCKTSDFSIIKKSHLIIHKRQEYQYKSCKPSKQTEAHYTAQGRIVDQFCMNSETEEYYWNWNYKYEEDRIIKTEFLSYSKNQVGIHYTWDYYYDKSGFLKSVEVKRYLGDVLTDTRLCQYQAGKKSRETVWYYTKDDKPSVLSMWEYIYNEDEKKASLKYLNKVNNFSFTKDFEYYGDFESYYLYQNDNDFTLQSRKTDYDSNDRILKIESQGQVSQQEINEYDDKGRLMEKIIMDIEGVVLSSELYRYDLKGNVVLQQKYGLGKQLMNEYIYEYVYDDYGNWIEKITFYSDNIREQYKVKTTRNKRYIKYHVFL